MARPPRGACSLDTDVMEVKALLDRVSSALRQVGALSREIPKGRSKSPPAGPAWLPSMPAVSFLPEAIQFPVRLVVWATERALSLAAANAKMNATAQMELTRRRWAQLWSTLASREREADPQIASPLIIVQT